MGLWDFSYFCINFGLNFVKHAHRTIHGSYMSYFRSDSCSYLSLVMRKTDFCMCENKDADQLRGNREADQRLCFRQTDSTIPLLP